MTWRAAFKLILKNVSIRGSLCLCPAHLPLHLLQQLSQQLIDRFEGLAVALLSKGHIVEHVMVRNGSVNLRLNTTCKLTYTFLHTPYLHKTSVNINQLNPAVTLHIFHHHLIHLRVPLP